MDQPPRPPATLPPLEDVDSLIARNAPIARTRKRRSENFERCTTATTAGQYLSMGAARKAPAPPRPPPPVPEAPAPPRPRPPEPRAAVPPRPRPPEPETPAPRRGRWRFRDRDPDENLLEQLQDAGARLRQRGRERDAARAEAATLRRERDEALRERDAARKQLAARNDMLAQVLKEQQY